MGLNKSDWVPQVKMLLSSVSFLLFNSRNKDVLFLSFSFQVFFPVSLEQRNSGQFDCSGKMVQIY